MKSNVVGKKKKPKPQDPKTKPQLYRLEKAVLAFAVYATLDTDLAVVLNNLSVPPSLEEKDAQCRFFLRSRIAVSEVWCTNYQGAQKSFKQKQEWTAQLCSPNITYFHLLGK